jgi:hypothetical protein
VRFAAESVVLVSLHYSTDTAPAGTVVILLSGAENLMLTKGIHV